MRWTPAEIKRRRDARGLSQQQLAERIGASRRAITNWETGVAEPRGSNLRALEEALGDDQPDDNDEDRILRGIDDGKLWAEATRRFFGYAAAAHRPDQAPPGRGQHAPLPTHLLPAQSDKRGQSDR